MNRPFATRIKLETYQSEKPTKMKITKEIFDNAMDFETYDKHVKDLFARGKTTGDDQSIKFIHYTKLGIQRIKRGLKTITIEDKVIESLRSTKSTNWMIITEAWCGDAANILPVVIKMAEAEKRVSLKIILRDQNLKIMDRFLTNGARAIPIVIFFDDNFNELASWGARPKPAQQIVIAHKENPVKSIDEVKVDLQKWYIEDKGQTIQNEFRDILESFE